MWSPAPATLRIAAVSAAWPEAKATAWTPPSREAMRFSRASTVGFVRRVYTGPRSSSAKRCFACSAESKT